MVRTAIYTRVSTEDQAKEGYSLEAQLERLESYCEAQGWEVVARYVDDGHSGRSTNRPAYRRMMEERERWDLILVMKMDRIHRNSKNFMIMMENLERWGKKFTSMNESLDTSTAVGRFVVDIIQRIAQLESEQIGERTYMGMAQKAESFGGILGFYPPFGYHLKNGHLITVELEAPIVAGLFQSYLAGNTMSDIAWRLNQEGVMTRRGNPWTVWSISHILHNPIYAGKMRWDGRIISTDHEPIVSTEVFNLVQSKIAEMTRHPKNRRDLRLNDKDDLIGVNKNEFHIHSYDSS
jgi:DNA invertase Pin-like site-specific DNA recombinase